MNEICVIGASRSGKSLIAGMLNCSPNAVVQIADDWKLTSDVVNVITVTHSDYIVKGLSILGDLNNLGKIKVIWSVRDPIQSICSYVKNFDLPIATAFQYWFDINTILWYYCTSLSRENFILAKYEDIIMASRIEQIFAFVDVPYDPQYAQYGDFDQPILSLEFNRGKPDIERLAWYKPSDFGVKEECSIYANKPLLNFLRYKLNTLD